MCSECHEDTILFSVNEKKNLVATRLSKSVKSAIKSDRSIHSKLFHVECTNSKWSSRYLWSFGLITYVQRKYFNAKVNALANSNACYALSSLINIQSYLVSKHVYCLVATIISITLRSSSPWRDVLYIYIYIGVVIRNIWLLTLFKCLVCGRLITARK